MANGGDAVIEKLYAQYVTETEDGYHLSLKVDLESPPDDTEKLCTDIANLKRNLLGAPFDYVFSEMDNNNVVDMISINYRQGEVMYIKPAKEEVTVVFSIKFKDIDDVILAKVFLQVSFSPHLLFTIAPPTIHTNHKLSPISSASPSPHSISSNLSLSPVKPLSIKRDPPFFFSGNPFVHFGDQVPFVECRSSSRLALSTLFPIHTSFFPPVPPCHHNFVLSYRCLRL
eukprot:TRINITY_DN252_c0_g1_i11.p1 TRINITY_DN252_c0_g1~~TRINITY_DN252_c0_g1_i11.p1  ORF type:complete len:228 (-),score=52.83 TRINITY_DN252_c0_g1_i11:29-712(-)